MNLRFAFRLLRQNPGFTLVAVLSLALGIGANTAIFSVMDALLLRTLPVEKPRELVWFGTASGRGVATNFPRGEAGLFSQRFRDLMARENRSFAGVSGLANLMAEGHARLMGGAELERLSFQLVDGEYFRVLGVRTEIGRPLTARDDRAEAPPVAMISDALWQRRFKRAGDVLGKTIALNGVTYEIVGVTAEGFQGLEVGRRADVFLPLVHSAKVLTWVTDTQEHLTQYLHMVARLKPGVTRASAQAEVDVLYQQWLRAAAGPQPSAEQLESMKTARAKLTDAAYGISELRSDFSRALTILLAVVGVVLLIACANLANLLLARAAGRQRELAVRVALGAKGRDLAAQMLGESLLLALLGGLAGLLLAWWGAQFLVSMVGMGEEVVWLEVGPNWRVFGFMLALSLVTGLLFGLLPAWRAARVDAGPALKEGKGAVTGSAGWWGRALVVAQVAMAVLLTAGAGLFVRSLLELRRVNPGFDQRVMVVSLSTESAGLKEDTLPAWAERLKERLRALPGIRQAGFSMLHFGGGRWGTNVFREGVARVRANRVSSDGNMVDAEYFDAVGVKIVRGRSFSAMDARAKTQVAIVSETLARQLYPETPEVVGRRFSFPKGETFEIIGVASDTRVAGLRQTTPRGIFYLFNQQARSGFGDLMIRAEGDPARHWAAIRAAVREENANVGIHSMATLGDYVDDSLAQERLLARLAGFFGALALALAAIGLYGVLAYAVSRRTAEIGVRMALGARPEQVLAAVLRESLALIALGLALGVPVALVAGQWIQDQLFGLTARDPLTLAGSAGVLLAVGLGAASLPAWRASRLDPVRALRQE